MEALLLFASSCLVGLGGLTLAAAVVGLSRTGATALRPVELSEDLWQVADLLEVAVPDRATPAQLRVVEDHLRRMQARIPRAARPDSAARQLFLRLVATRLLGDAAEAHRQGAGDALLRCRRHPALERMAGAGMLVPHQLAVMRGTTDPRVVARVADERVITGTLAWALRWTDAKRLQPYTGPLPSSATWPDLQRRSWRATLRDAAALRAYRADLVDLAALQGPGDLVVLVDAEPHIAVLDAVLEGTVRAG